MARISESTIEHIRTTADIVDVISRYIELKKKGRNFFGLCPFHGEKTPSFSVNSDKQIYKCFGCGEGGGVINFIMGIDKLDFIEATKKLAQMYNIHIESTKDDVKSSNLKSQLLEINHQTVEFYKKNINDTAGDKIKEYLYKRGFDDTIINEFDIGYSFNKPNQLLKHLQQMNFKSEALKKSGLFFENDKGYFDRFRSRLIFPIKNRTGETIGFAGRITDKNNNIAKYINSPETPIYNKSKIFYGLDKSSEFIKKENSVIIVEGYFDLMQLVKNNIKNVVAISGTSFTDMHASIIKQYTDNINIAFDGDVAGKKAAIRTGYILLKNSIDSKIIEIPENFDPDDWVKSNGADIFLDSIKIAKHTINFHYSLFNKDDRQSINNFIDEAINEIIHIKEPIFREISAKRLSELTNVSEESIMLTLNNLIKKRVKFKADVIHEEIRDDSTLLEDDLIRLCLNKEKFIRKFIFNNIDTNWIKSDIHKEIFDHLYIHLNADDGIPINLILNKIEDNTIRNKITDLLINIEKFSPTIEMAYDCLIRLEKNVLKNTLNDLRNNLKNVNQTDMISIITDITKIENSINELDKKYS